MANFIEAPVNELISGSRLAIAALIGLGVGLEREWDVQSHRSEPRFAGIRTFLLLGLVGGSAGLLLAVGAIAATAVILAAGLGFCVAAYVMAVGRPHRSTDGTTEAAALLVICLGVLAGVGWIVLAAATASVVVLALAEKQRLHGLVAHLDETELHAALRFSVLALVVLPLLPDGPFLGVLEVRPRTLWIVVLILSALNFAAFIVRRAVGTGRGYGLLGILGGLVSSTLVTLTFSRRSHREPKAADSLAYGVVGACTALVPKVLVLSALLDLRVAVALLPFLLPVALIGAGIVAWGWWSLRGGEQTTKDTDKSPLRLAAAIRMGIAFQVALSLIQYVRTIWAGPGLYATAVVLGVSDADALVYGMTRSANEITVFVAARCIAIGILATTLLKLTLSLALGVSQFRRIAAAGLATMAAIGALALWFVRG